MRAIIIEDETAAIRNLKTILRDVAPEVSIIAALDSITKSVAWLSANEHPDFIFMDIQLADGESFHIFDRVKIEVPVIFITAYDEYALRAFKANGIDYLLKPVSPGELAASISKLKKFTLPDHDNYIERLSKLVQNRRYPNTVIIFHKDKIIPLDTASVACLYSQDEKTYARTLHNDLFPVGKTLNSMMEDLCPETFFRANRQYIIARGAIKEISVCAGGRLDVALSIPLKDHILISKEKAGDFKKWLQE